MTSTPMPETATDSGGSDIPPNKPTAIGNNPEPLIPIQRGEQEELPNRRVSVTYKVKINNQSVYITFGNYPDGRLAEIFIHAARIGTFTRGMLDNFGLISAKALQFGMPIEEFVKSFRYAQFDPQGLVVGDSEIDSASSIVDYIAHRIELDYVQNGRQS